MENYDIFDKDKKKTHRGTGLSGVMNSVLDLSSHARAPETVIMRLQSSFFSQVLDYLLY